MKKGIVLAGALAFGFFMANAQQNPKHDPTEVYTPEPKVVTPGKALGDAPSDAIILFNGTNTDKWESAKDTTKPAGWVIEGDKLRVVKSTGDIRTKKLFTNYQLHIEWQVPADISGSGQARGNSGVFLADLGGNWYELQVLDSYNNKTYVNGMAGSIYKEFIPLANPTRPPGEWQTYDVVWTAPLFNDDGTLKSPAKAIVFFNGVLVENDVTLPGVTFFNDKPFYHKHGPAPIGLQAHGDFSKPIAYRNIWVREL